MKTIDKSFKKGCYLTIKKEKKNIVVEIFLNETYCDQPIKRFTFNKNDSLLLNGLYIDVLVKEYENSYS